ncbi:hypothetical protein E5D57_007561 [Metarhizium anisopliae]|nr:hypothetical protein E5D57_007561 [Metarhizium anisopliae]
MKIETVAVIVALADGGLTAPKPEADVAPEQNRVNMATVDDANIEQAGVIYDSLRPRDNQEAQAVDVKVAYAEDVAEDAAEDAAGEKRWWARKRAGQFY